MVDVTVIRPNDDGPPRLIAASAYDLEQLERLPFDKLGLASITYPRNIRHLRYYWALVQVVADAIGVDKDALHVDLRDKCHFIRKLLLLPGGGSYKELESVSVRGGIDEARFTEYRIHAVNLIFAHYLPGVRRKDVWDKVREITGDSPDW